MDGSFAHKERRKGHHMHMRAPVRIMLSSGFLPLLLLGLCSIAFVPHGKSVHARVPASRSIRSASRSSESYLVVDAHEGSGAQSAAVLGLSVGHKDQPKLIAKAPVLFLAVAAPMWNWSTPILLPRGSLNTDPSPGTVTPRSPRGPPSLL